MNGHRMAVILFAGALGVAVTVAFVTTMGEVNVRKVSNVAPPGTTGLAKPHPRLDRAPGEPLSRGR
jgi:hypothetical protein